MTESERWAQVKAALRSVQERGRDSLDEVCGADAELRQEVLALLEADEAGGGQFEEPAVRAAGRWLTEDLHWRPPARLGDWRVGAEFDRGGMSRLYRVDHVAGGPQGAAMKILSAGACGEEILRRFRQETSILGRLSHPSIVPLLDSGVSPDGWPYLVMPMVEGASLNDFAAPLPLPARLDLFQKICAAVTHAHEQGVLHRDLKPSNIRVRPGGEPMLLDFGIARLYDPAGLETWTQTLGISLTLDYASPEQARGEKPRVASDIYSLGVVLLELLTGHLPYSLAGASYYEAIRIISEREPDLSGLPLALAPVVAHALEKDPRARPASVAAFAREVERARRRSVWSRPLWSAQVFYRRRRRQVSAAVGALALAGAALWWSHRGGDAPDWQRAEFTSLALTDIPGVETTPSLSPGGELAYGTYYQLWRRKPGEDPVLFHSSPDQPMGGATWSRDGRWLATTRSRDNDHWEILVFSAADGRAPAAVFTGGPYRSWSHDSRSILFSHRPPGPEGATAIIQEYRLATREIRQVTFPPAGFWGDTFIAASPVDDQFAVVRYSSPGRGEVYLGRMGQRDVRPVTHVANWISGLDWFPNGRDLLMLTSDTAYRMRPGQPPVLLPQVFAIPHNPEVRALPDGTWQITYEARFVDHDLTWLDLETGQRRQVAVSRRDEKFPSLSSRGQLVFQSHRDRGDCLFVLENPAGRERRLTCTSESYVHAMPAWSPDGERIAYVERVKGFPSIVLIDAGGAHRRLLTTGHDDGNPTWSADGKTIYFRSDRSGKGEIWAMAASGEGDPRQITRSGGDRAQESPDGRYLYMANAFEHANLLRRALPEGPDEVVGVTLPQSAHWMIQGRTLWMILWSEHHKQPRLQQVDLGTGQRTIVPGGVVEDPRGLTVSPDGRQLVWSNRGVPESDLWALQIRFP